ncbi:DUF7718 family protein [Haladaptatus halobius]|uniref:DUF7718 family protein n=1 Tax=Haladaptatus halobius TaxID=2884875 RepID=UPI001D0A30CE|nr:hypothetical protein [Haladaptatus halobius]
MSSPDTIEYELDTWRGRIYLLRIRGTPSYFDPDDFAVTVYYKDAATETHIEIARVDTAHDFTHFDRLFRNPPDKKPVEWDIWDAVDHFEENWPTYAKRYEENRT